MPRFAAEAGLDQKFVYSRALFREFDVVLHNFWDKGNLASKRTQKQSSNCSTCAWDSRSRLEKKEETGQQMSATSDSL